MKKICIIYANCQNSLIAEYLGRSQSFNREYTIRRFPVHLLMTKGKTIPDKILRQAKLFIYQPVKATHGDLSSQALLDKLPTDCQQISFPSLYFTGYFPQYCKNPVAQSINPNYPYGVIPHGDTNIISMLDRGKEKAEIIARLSDPDFYTPESLLSNLNETLSVLEQRETELDVKVSKFIRANYQHRQLFYTQNHPTDILGMHVVNQILQLLNLPVLGDPLAIKDTLRGVLDNFQIPLYPSVIKHLNLNFANNQTVYKHGSFCTNRMTFERYISEYIELHNSTSKSANAYHFKAIELQNDGRYKQAIATIKEAIKLKSHNAVYYKNLANLFQQQNNLNGAKQAYNKAIELSPDWEEFYQLLGEVLVKKKDWLTASSTFKQAISLAPNNAKYHHLLGNALFQLNRFDEAQESYEAAIRLEPNKAHLYRCLGDVLIKMNKLDLAATNYKKAIEIAPNRAYFYRNLGNVLAQQNKLDEATSACERAIELDNKNSTFYLILGDIQLQKGEVDCALQTYQRAIELNPAQVRRIFAQLGDFFKEKADTQTGLELVKA